LAVIGAIVGEFIAGGGLGGVIDAARTRQRIELVFAAVLSASALGLVFFLSINAASFTLLRHWHPSERE
jgi:NitT/TauT family transport system permease protein